MRGRPFLVVVFGLAAAALAACSDDQVSQAMVGMDASTVAKLESEAGQQYRSLPALEKMAVLGAVNEIAENCSWIGLDSDFVNAAVPRSLVFYSPDELRQASKELRQSYIETYGIDLWAGENSCSIADHELRNNSMVGLFLESEFYG